MFIVLVPAGTYAYYARDISDPERLMNHNNTGVVLLDRHGEAFYSRGIVRDIKQVKLDNISPHVPKALIASEDEDFYTQPGFSIKGMARALFSNVSSADLTSSGGSSITQQLVKNNLLTSDKNLLRKYQELSMAVAIDRHYTKDQILEMYLNSVYFGNDAFGIEAAAQNYFGKPAKDLSLAESSMLIGLLPAPSAYSPVTGDPELAKKRQNYVLSRMVKEKYVDDATRKAAASQELKYHRNVAEEEGNAHHFALMVVDELNKKYGEERVNRSGFKVKTTLDLGWQRSAESTVAKQIEALSSRGGRNGSLIAIDPKNGEVRALVGSADWDNPEYGKVNMAIMARQPGSSFKPIYYAQALQDKKITAATTLKDQPTDFGGGYRPTNYDFRYRGDVTTRYALANSLNIPAVEVMDRVGVETATRTAQRMGITTINDPEKYGLSLALGTAEARLIDMTNAYAAFANGGEQYKPATINEVKDKFGSVVHQNKPKAKRVMEKESSYIVTSILADEKARAPLAGSAFNIGRPAAVKTGTTNDNKDAWTIGYTPQVVVGVWVGNNDNQPMRGIGGSLGAGPIWRSAITSFSKNVKAEAFKVPSGVVLVPVCGVSGTSNEYFIRGTEDEFKCAAKPRDENENKKRDDEEKAAEEKKPETKPEEKKPEQIEDPAPTEELPEVPAPTDGGGTGGETGGGTGTGGRGGGSGGTTTTTQ